MKRAAPWVLIAVAVLVIALLSAGGDDTGEPLDPRSTGPLGARGLVLLLEEMGATVEIGPAPPAAGDGRKIAVLLADELGKNQRERLEAWVESGGTLIVADPLSRLAPPLDRGGGSMFDAEEPDDTLRPNCDLPALRSVSAIEVPQAAMYRVRAASDVVGCFPAEGDRDGAYLVATGRGSGTVVALGGGAPFINDRLGDADNSVLAVSLMAPTAGTAVTFLEADAPGSGDDSLIELIPDNVRRGFWQLVIAFAAVVIWLGRRLARPVEEAQPVQIPGSELVVATGNLLHQAGRRDAAADMLRHQLRRDLADRYGIPLDATPEQVASLLASRGVDAARVTAALAPRGVVDDRSFVELAALIESTRREVTHV